jgi:hypothetical protein
MLEAIILAAYSLIVPSLNSHSYTNVLSIGFESNLTMTFPSESTAQRTTLANAAESPWSKSTSALIRTSVRECIKIGLPASSTRSASNGASGFSTSSSSYSSASQSWLTNSGRTLVEVL